jgi:hypothetical protein
MLLAYNIYNAYMDYRLISSNKPVNHTWNAIRYSILASILALTYIIVKHLGWLDIIWFVIFSYAFRKLVFDIALNLLRGKAWYYVSDTSGSEIDKVEHDIFGTNGHLPKYIYATISLITLVLILF